MKMISKARLLSLFLFMCAYSPVNAQVSDMQHLVNQLQSNRDDRNCVTIKRIIDNSMSIDLNYALRLSIQYQSDCAFDALKRHITFPRPHEAFSGFLDALAREYHAMKGTVRRDGGQYGAMGLTTKRAIEAGLLDRFPAPDIAGYLALTCEIPDNAAAITWLMYICGPGIFYVQSNPYAWQISGRQPTPDTPHNYYLRTCPTKNGGPLGTIVDNRMVDPTCKHRSPKP